VDMQFSSEDEAFRIEVRQFFSAEYPVELLEKAASGASLAKEDYQKSEQAYAKRGWLCVNWPVSEGGPGWTVNQKYIFDQELEYAGAIVPVPMGVIYVGPVICAFGTEEQKARWLPKCVSGENILAIAMTEPGAGSDVSGIRTTAEDKGDHFLLNGSKTFISNGILADLVIVAAKTDPNSSHGLSLLVVERGMDGFERGKNLRKMGMHSQDTAELFFNNVKVPKENLLGEFNRGFYHLMHFLAEERLLSAAGSLANAEAAYAVTMEYASERRVFGQMVADFQVNRFKFADMRTEMDVAQTFIDRCVMVHNDGKLTAEDAAKAKLFATELEDRVTDQCVQLHGGSGYMDEYPISRMYTAARVSRIYAGSSEIMREIIARSIGLDPRKKKKDPKKDAA